MSDFILGLQSMEQSNGVEDGTLGSSSTSLCCACSWLSLGC